VLTQTVCSNAGSITSGYVDQKPLIIVNQVKLFEASAGFTSLAGLKGVIED